MLDIKINKSTKVVPWPPGQVWHQVLASKIVTLTDTVTVSESQTVKQSHSHTHTVSHSVSVWASDLGSSSLRKSATTEWHKIKTVYIGW